MANKITGSASRLPVPALRVSGSKSPAKAIGGPIGPTPQVSSKLRLSAEELNKRVDGLFKFTEINQPDANALAEMLSASGTDKAEVRESIRRMRSYASSCMLSVRSVKTDDFPFLLKFSRLWAQTSEEQRKVFQFGKGFDDIVAGIRPPIGPVVVSRK